MSAEKARKANADATAAKVLPMVRELHETLGLSLRATAEKLNAMGLTTRQKSTWAAQSVENALAKG